MAFDTDKLRSHLKESGLFSDAEIEAEVLSAVKDSKAEERRAILNTQKIETPAVAQSSPAIAAAPAVAAAPAAAPVPAAAVPPVAKPITGATTPAELFDMRPKGTPVERIGGMIGEAGTAAAPVAANATQSALDYARDAIANNQELTAGLAAIPIMYGANKLGLFDTLGSKMSSTAQPQPMVGGAGPRATPQPDQMAGSYWDWFNRQPANQVSGSPSAPQPQAWDIHGDPSFGNFLGDGTAPAAATPAAPAAAPSRNLTLEEASARMAGVTPAAGEMVGPPAMVGPRQPVVPNATNQAIIAAHQAEMAINEAKLANQNAAPSAAPNSAATQAVTETIQQLGQAETPVAGAAMPSRPVTPTLAAALPTGEPVPPVLSQRVQTAITGVPKTVQDQYAKEGKVVLKGYGVGDRSLTNTYGIPAYQKIIDYFNEGKPIGDDANYQIIRKKINQGVPASLAAEFAAKLPGSEAEAGNFGKAFGETGAYTKEGKVVTSPAAMKKAVAGGGALFLATAFPNIVNAAQRGDKGPLLETAFDIGVGAIPVVGTAAQAMMGTNVGAPTVRSEPFADVLQRPEVRKVLQNMQSTMSPSEFNAARDKYLAKVSEFPTYNSLRFTKPAIGSTQPINRKTLLPIAPPR